jgi:hypothetical protein
MIPRIPYVRLYDPEADADYSAPADKAIPDGHTVIEGHPAVDGNGDPLPVKQHVDLATAVADGPKGDQLERALTAAGLPLEGTADEKRIRLAEWQAENPEVHVTGQENNS